MASQSMNGATQGSTGVTWLARRHQQPRRSWTQAEQDVLIASLRDLIGQGWKSNNGFRAGYLRRLEVALKRYFPGTDLKGNPHINSKLCSWKKNYYSLNAILSRTGVGFNLRGTFLIECEDEVWEQIVKLDPNARVMRYKSWPYFDAWQEIFGKDRANGEAAEDLLDAEHAIRDEDDSSNGRTGSQYGFHVDEDLENEGEGDSVSQFQKSGQPPKPKRKKQKLSDDMKALCDFIKEIGEKTDARLANLAQRVGYEFDLGKSKTEAFTQLAFIPWLSREQRYDVCEILSKDVSKLEVFRGLPTAVIPHYVERLIMRAGS